VLLDPGLEAFLINHGVEISAKPIQEERSPWATLLYSFGPGLLFIGFYIWLFQRAARQGGGLGGGMLGIGKSKARRYDQEPGPKVTFDEVAGIDEAENELVEVVDFLKDPPKYGSSRNCGDIGTALRDTQCTRLFSTCLHLGRCPQTPGIWRVGPAAWNWRTRRQDKLCSSDRFFYLHAAA